MIVEKVARVKANSRVAREMQVSHALERTLTSISRNLSHAEDRLNKVADQLNKCRGLFLEASGFELILDETAHVNGAPQDGGIERSETRSRTERTEDTDVLGVVEHDPAVHKSTVP